MPGAYNGRPIPDRNDHLREVPPVGDGPIRSVMDAEAYCRRQIERLREMRAEINQAVLIEVQRKLYEKALIRFGGALTALDVLRLTGHLGDLAYMSFRDEVMLIMTGN